jgi:hypothetical protein
MGKVKCEISMSLDGFIAGPTVSSGDGMGDDGGLLHDRRFDAKTETDNVIVDEIHDSTEAVLIGKRMSDGGTTYTCVTDGIEAALERACVAAGDKDVGIWGGANIIEQYLAAGLLDEMQIHLIPLLFGGGTRLFEDLGGRRIELRRMSTIDTPGATHLRFDVVR